MALSTPSGAYQKRIVSCSPLWVQFNCSDREPHKSLIKNEFWQDALCHVNYYCVISSKPTLRHFCLLFCLVVAPLADGEDATTLSTPLMKRIISSTSLSLSSVAADVEPAADDAWLAGCGDSAGDWRSEPAPACDWFFLSFYITSQPSTGYRHRQIRSLPPWQDDHSHAVQIPQHFQAPPEHRSNPI